MLAEKAFKCTVKRVFGDNVWEDTILKDKYQSVLDNRDKGLSCGKYGDDVASINLMLYLRDKMRIQNLVSEKFLPFYEFVNSEDNLKLYKFFLNKDNWITSEYEEKFPESAASEPEVRLDEAYNYDGWNYDCNGICLKDIDEKKEWIVKNKNIKTHYYFNQLDHYLTYLVGKIRKKNKRMIA